MKSSRLPVLDNISSLTLVVKSFIYDLDKLGFKGDINPDYASRVSTSMDNSIYRIVPTLVVFPKDKEDVSMVFDLAAKLEYREMKFSPRGGGTATSGHSLCAGVILDSSKYMNKILNINVSDEYVIVQPGVVLDQLNDALADTQYFFAPNLSPSNRATLGGMVSTDACGKGSRIYGRTSQHVLSVSCNLVTGDKFDTKIISVSEIDQLKLTNVEKNIYKTVVEHIVKNTDDIEEKLPKLSRFLTGYNLSKTYNKKTGLINLSQLITGSEGTLAFVTEIKLKLTRKPKAKSLFAISYDDFGVALKDAKELLSFDPSAIETVDDNIVELAKNDEVYHKIKHMLEKDDTLDLKAVNFVELIADTECELKGKSKDLEDLLAKKSMVYHFTTDSTEMDSLWELRKKGVGLLGSMKGNRKPIPFIEDTAVAPEHLADYIIDLTKLLDSHGVKYGMFGHVDVGCLHVRPALDMTLVEDKIKVLEITKEVNKLVMKYGGILCSEHGHGFRSEYLKDYFGTELYDSLGHIKKAFDPYNQLNPGKITVPAGSNDSIVKMDGPFRSDVDKLVSRDMREQFSGAYNCNGNSQCLNYNLDAVICPSAKADRNWLHSPKGRSSVIREWLSQLSAVGYSTIGQTNLQGDTKKRTHPNDFSHEVYESLDKCLGCKACVTSCPIKVDIPEMKSKFLESYHSRYKRPITDYFVKYSEKMLSANLHMPVIVNDMFNTQFVRAGLLNAVGVVDTPSISSMRLKAELIKRKAPKFDINALKNLSDDEKSKTVCIVQDIFTSLYDTKVALSLYDFLTGLGYTVYVAPYRVNGKPAHVKGFLKYFDKQAIIATDLYNEIADCNIDMIGVDPAMTLVYRDEYRKALAEKVKFNVQMIQEWLVTKLDDLPTMTNMFSRELNLFTHCTEKSLSVESDKHWKEIFNHFGVKIETVAIGCCGMSGSFGHEKKHQDTSKKIYDLSWSKKIKEKGITNSMSTGFSCRCQVKRMEGHVIKHPIEILEINRKKQRMV